MWTDRLGLGVLLAGTAAALALVPVWPLAHVADPAIWPSVWAVIGYCVVFLLLLLSRALGGRHERALLAVFLAGMPLVYLADSLWVGGGQHLGLEVAGVVLYLGLAIAGLLRWPRLLAIGIGGHAAWDLMHLGVGTAYVPGWYVAVCAVADLSLAVYAWLRSPAAPRG